MHCAPGASRPIGGYAHATPTNQESLPFGVYAPLRPSRPSASIHGESMPLTSVHVSSMAALASSFNVTVVGPMVDLGCKHVEPQAALDCAAGFTHMVCQASTFQDTVNVTHACFSALSSISVLLPSECAPSHILAPPLLPTLTEGAHVDELQTNSTDNCITRGCGDEIDHVCDDAMILVCDDAIKLSSDEANTSSEPCATVNSADKILLLSDDVQNNDPAPHSCQAQNVGAYDSQTTTVVVTIVDDMLPTIKTPCDTFQGTSVSPVCTVSIASELIQSDKDAAFSDAPNVCNSINVVNTSQEPCMLDASLADTTILSEDLRVLDNVVVRADSAQLPSKAKVPRANESETIAGATLVDDVLPSINTDQNMFHGIYALPVFNVPNTVEEGHAAKLSDTQASSRDVPTEIEVTHAAESTVILGSKPLVLAATATVYTIPPADLSAPCANLQLEQPHTLCSTCTSSCPPSSSCTTECCHPSQVTIADVDQKGFLICNDGATLLVQHDDISEHNDATCLPANRLDCCPVQPPIRLGTINYASTVTRCHDGTFGADASSLDGIKDDDMLGQVSVNTFQALHEVS